VIARYMGLVLLVNALFMFVSVIISAIYGFDTGFSPLLLSAIITAYWFLPLHICQGVQRGNHPGRLRDRGFIMDPVLSLWYAALPALGR